MRDSFCPIRYDGTEICMGKPCALSVQDIKSGMWFCSVAINSQTVTGRFRLNAIASGKRPSGNNSGDH